MSSSARTAPIMVAARSNKLWQRLLGGPASENGSLRYPESASVGYPPDAICQTRTPPPRSPQEPMPQPAGPEPRGRLLAGVRAVLRPRRHGGVERCEDRHRRSDGRAGQRRWGARTCSRTRTRSSGEPSGTRRFGDARPRTLCAATPRLLDRRARARAGRNAGRAATVSSKQPPSAP